MSVLLVVSDVDNSCVGAGVGACACEGCVGVVEECLLKLQGLDDHVLDGCQEGSLCICIGGGGCGCVMWKVSLKCLTVRSITGLFLV